ncbi:MAG: DNA primase [Chitinophagaceae bacterium]
MIPQETIQEIQNRIDIIDIVGSFVKLKKRGSNYIGVCPFHNEKTPSFTVSPSKEIYKCFGCGKSGNTISFIMEHERYSYVEALKWLAARYNIEIQEEFANPEQRLQQQTADSLFILNKFAQEFFSKMVWDDEEGKMIGLSYLRERGFTDDIIQKFQLGYCPEDGLSFSKAAIAQQYNPELLIKSGLAVSRDNRVVDNYRGRVIFPIHNQSGKVLGFGARLIRKNDKAPKYINTPENEIYIKSKVLYGMYFARQAIGQVDECLLVEGYTDVISLHQAGVENVVASSGTALTIEQLRLIRKFTQNLTIIYDGDSAGIKAATRGLDLALEEGLHVKLVLIPDNEDPDSYVKKVGAENFREFIQNEKKDIILFQLEIAMKDLGNDPVKKSALVNQIADSISRINKAEDFTRQQHYIQRSAELLKIDEEGLTNLVNKHIRDRIQTDERKQFQRELDQSVPTEEISETDLTLDLISRDEQQERAVVKCLIEFGLNPWEDEKTVADYIFEEFEDGGLADMFDNQPLLKLIAQFKTWYKQGLAPTGKNFLYHEEPELNILAVSLMDNSSYEISPNWHEKFDRGVPTREEQYIYEVRSCISYLKLKKIKRLIVENQKDLETNTDPELLKTLIETHQHLKLMEVELVKNSGTVILK